MGNRLIIDGNSVYEIDEECLKRKQGKNLELKPARRGNMAARKLDVQPEKKQKESNITKKS